MNADANTVVEPSATTAVPQAADNWDEHGTPIVTQKQPKTEEPAASATPAKETKPERKPKNDAEPGAARSEPKPKAKPSAEERISELTAERKAAEKRASDLEERLRKLESAAQPTPRAEAKPEAKKEPPKRPNPFTWTGTQEEFDKAMDEWQQHHDEELAAKVSARTRQEQAQTEAQKSMSEILKQTTAKHPDAKEKITAATNEIMGEKTPFFVKAFVNESDVIGELLYALADQTTLDNLLEAAKANPGKALRVMRDMELDIQKDLSKPEEKPEEKAPETKPRAPKPPSEVGGRGAATEDAAVAAAKDGKFNAFDAEMRRKHFAA